MPLFAAGEEGTVAQGDRGSRQACRCCQILGSSQRLAQEAEVLKADLEADAWMLRGPPHPGWPGQRQGA